MYEATPKGPEGKLPIEEQVSLAKKLAETVREANALSRQYPDMDDLAVFLDGSPDNRSMWEGLEKARSEAREELDREVPDKRALIDHLRERDEDKLADMIKTMFQVGI